MATKIQLRRGTAAQWTSANPTLSEGEIGLETDTLKAKLGNGLTAWNSLTYFIGVLSLENGNGTTANGNAVDIGGEVTATETIVQIEGTKDLFIGSTDEGYGFYFIGSGASHGLSSNTGGIFVDRDGAMRVPDNRGTPRGIQYGGNYHSGYTNQSLVDKEYVDNKGIISVSTSETLSNVQPNGVIDAYAITALVEALTIRNPSTDYANFDGFMLRIYSASAQTLTWQSKYRAQGEALPATTTAGKVMLIVCVRDSGTDKYDTKVSIEV